MSDGIDHQHNLAWGAAVMKKAIYLDERERDLAFRLCAFVVWCINQKLNDRLAYEVMTPACQWYRKEVLALQAKFADQEHGQ